MPSVLKPALTVAEVSELTGFSIRTIGRLFEHEPGVIMIARPSKMNKRRYRSVRIPRGVFERVIGKLAVK